MEADCEKKDEQTCEMMYRELFNHMSSGVAIYNVKNNGRDFIFKEFNNAAERIEKMPKDKAIGKNVLEIFPGINDFGLLDVFKRVWKTGKPEHHPISQYKDNRISGWRQNYVFKLPTGEIVSVYDDVTEQKKVQEELVLNEKLLKSNILELQELNRKLRENEKKYRKRTEELEKFNKLVVGRELKMIELKKKIKELEEQLKIKQG